MGTERPLMGGEGRSQRGDGAAACFYSNLCKWACLHYAGFLCEARSQTDHSVGPQGPRACGSQRLYFTWHGEEAGQNFGGGERMRNVHTRGGISEGKQL